MRLALAFLTASACFAQAQMHHIVTHSRTWEVYTVEYDVDDGMLGPPVSVPLTIPAGVPHYQAKIRVYGPFKTLIASFDGTWTAEGCFEDDPAALVAFALKEKAK